MALIRDLVDPYDEGTLRAYYRLEGLAVDALMQTIDATLLVYRSKAARDAGKGHFDRVNVHADETTTPSYSELVASFGGIVYDFTKQQPDWAGAEDA